MQLLRSFAGRRLLGAALALFLCLPASSRAAGDSYRLLAREGRGLLVERAGRRILFLQGGPWEMGYQQGVLLREEIRRTADSLLMLGFSRQPPGIGTALAFSRGHLDPAHLEELSGLARGAGISLERAFLVNAFPGLLDAAGSVSWGAVSGDGLLRHGFSLDDLAGIGLAERLVIRVVRPDGRRPFVSPGFAGLVGVLAGFNDRGLAVGGREKPFPASWDGSPMAFTLRRVLEESSSLREAASVLRETARAGGYYCLVSDPATPDARLFSITPARFEVLEESRADTPSRPGVYPARGLLLVGGPDTTPIAREALAAGPVDAGSAARAVAAGAGGSRLVESLFYPAEGILRLAGPGPGGWEGEERAWLEMSLGELLDYQARNEHTRGIRAGRLEPSKLRPVRPARDPSLEVLLARYAVEPDDIFWETAEGPGHPDFDFFSLRFNSLVRTPFPENNTVYAQYYRARLGPEPRRSVVLPDNAGDFAVSGLLARRLAAWGVNTLVVSLPYSGRRRPENPAGTPGFSGDLGDWARQAVSDVRAAAAWLAARPENDPSRVGIAGVSFGGILASLAAGVDGGFDRAALILAGVDLPGTSRRPASVDDPDPCAALRPLAFAPRLDRTWVLMVNATADANVPAESAWFFMQSLPRSEIRWYPGDHRVLASNFEEVIGLLGDHFTGEKPLFLEDDPARPETEEENEILAPPAG